MSNSILNEIRKIRREKELDILTDNCNEYRILIREDDGLSAYYFSSPIYNQNSKRLLDFKINGTESEITSDGISSKIFYYDKKVVIKSFSDEFTIKFNARDKLKKTAKNFLGANRECLLSNGITIIPTLNGAAFEIKPHHFDNAISIELPRAFDNIYENDSVVSFMSDEHLPYASVSAIICKTSAGECFPLRLNYEKTSDITYKFIFKPAQTIEYNEIESYFFEINAYAPKLIFDTTVESANPDKNNAYGSMAFLGHSCSYGEQWLYSRINPIKFFDLSYYSIKKATLLLPKYFEHTSKNDLEIQKLNVPWCSFGSTWNTKVDLEKRLCKTEVKNEYVSCDITEILKDMLRLKEPANPGIVIKPERGADTSAFIAAATSDNYFSPQILVLNLVNS